MEEIFTAQSDNIGFTENVKDGKTGELPKHPGEKPSKVIHVEPRLLLDTPFLPSLSLQPSLPSSL